MLQPLNKDLKVKISDGTKIPSTEIPEVDILQLNGDIIKGVWMIYDLPDSRHSNEIASQLEKNYYLFRALNNHSQIKIVWVFNGQVIITNNDTSFI